MGIAGWLAIIMAVVFILAFFVLPCKDPELIACWVP
mgnify:CR=1 FL=1